MQYEEDERECANRMEVYDERNRTKSDDVMRQNYVNFMMKPMTRAKMASASVTAIPTNIIA
ncbi:MAG: hypothetical protein Athens041674_397 [Parcubacteria group bacterium Athens0416_74]|nr:MAG: hypothetical protein Athens041674_397 [Parcubacteria group bacterium Athens0416_74]